jgi:hypothetical protein
MALIGAPLSLPGEYRKLRELISRTVWKERAVGLGKHRRAKRVSQAQRHYRVMIACMMQAWGALSESERAAWMTYAGYAEQTTVGYFLAWQMSRWAGNLPPTHVIYDSGESCGLAISEIWAVPIGGGVVVGYRAAAATNLVGALVVRASSPMGSFEHTRTVAAVLFSTTGWQQLTDVEGGKGVSYYRVLPFDRQGRAGVLSAEVSAAPL